MHDVDWYERLGTIGYKNCSCQFLWKLVGSFSKSLECHHLHLLRSAHLFSLDLEHLDSKGTLTISYLL